MSDLHYQFLVVIAGNMYGSLEFLFSLTTFCSELAINLLMCCGGIIVVPY